MNRYFNWPTNPQRFVRFDTARAEEVNAALDELSTSMDSLDDDINRAIKLPAGSADQVLNLSPAQRAGLTLAFNLAGNLTAIAGGGRFRGDWVTGTSYITGDLYRDAIVGDLYAVSTPHVSTTIATDVANNKAQMILDVGQVATYRDAAILAAQAAAASAGSASASASSANAYRNSAAAYEANAYDHAVAAAASAASASGKAPLDGVGTSGTWPIAITGNAGSANFSNAANAAWQSAPVAGGVANGDTTRSVTVRNNGGTGDSNVAALAFLCTGQYSIKLHLRADGFFGLGGWTSSAWRWYSTPDGDMVASGNVVAYSDPRLKQDFARITSPMSILQRLTGGTFTWRHGFAHTQVKAGKRDYGVLADQVKAVMPEIVSQSIEIDGETYDTVAYEKLVPVLIEAVKELHKRVAMLEGR